MPLTRITVVDDAMSPLFVGAGRAVIAAILASVALSFTRQAIPSARQCARLAVVAGGIVAGFPLLMSYALTSVPASHGAVVIALLPAATAVAVVVRTGERPPTAFWCAAAAGLVAAVGFAAAQSGGFGSLGAADLLLFAAVLAAAVGYAEGGLLARELGAWQTISWALVLAAPLMGALTVVAVVGQTPSGGFAEWSSFLYLGAVSMYLGFFAWYRGLAIGPMTSVSQTQLSQPVLSLGWAALLLHEPITRATALGGLAVIACAGLAVRTRSSASPAATVHAITADQGRRERMNDELLPRH